ncbi:MAG: C39 family peptidase [Patescibacteria group bacterium]
MNKPFTYLTPGRIIGLLVSFYLGCWLLIYWASLAQATPTVTPTHIPTPTPAREQIFHEDFTSSFDKWQLLSGNWSWWSLLNGRARAYIRNGSTVSMLTPKFDFWEDLGRNYEFSLDFQHNRGVDKNIAFGYIDNNNWYEIHFNNTIYNIVAFHNGFVTMDYLQNYLLDRGNHHFRIKFLDGRIRVWIDTELIADVRDSHFTGQSGRLLLRATTGASYPTEVFFDNLQVVRLNGEVGLGLDVWKQHDPLWANLTYDHMTQWSDRPTIRRWGCAMISAAMILRYWGYEWIDQDTRLTPQTINDWLSDQRDGFASEGRVNFLAITRLVRQLSEARIHRSQSLPQLPKLEYGRNDRNPFEAARTTLAAGHPVILAIDGHFLVGDGVIESEWELNEQRYEHDFLIKDPAYAYDLFSQHQTDLLSVRFLTPSFTDLSYLMLDLPVGVTVKIFDQSGNQLDTFEDGPITESVCPWDDELATTDCSQRLTASRQILLPKPESGMYVLRFSASQAQLAKIQLYAYDQAANVELIPLNLWIDSAPTEIELNYRKDGGTIVVWTGQWANFKQILYTAWQKNGLSKQYAFRQLVRLIAYAEQAGESKAYRYGSLIRQWLEKYRELFSTNYYQDLLNELPAK